MSNTGHDSYWLIVFKGMGKFLPAILLLISVQFWGCVREPEVADLVKYMLVETEYDTTLVNSNQNIFKTYNTFFINNERIGYVFNYPGADTVLQDGVNATDFVTPVIEAIIAGAESKDFTYVGEDNNPDFAIKAAVIRNFSVYQTINYPYYSGYYGYYGYYYPIVNNYYSDSAVLLIEMIDIKNYTANGNKYKVIWRAYIGDLLTTINLKTEALEAIATAFQQSPYIQKN